MTSDLFVYRSTDPRNLGLLDAYNAENVAFWRKAKRLVGSMFPREGRKPLVMSASGRERFIGVTGDKPSDAWKAVKGSYGVVGWEPKATKAGKEISDRFAKVQPPESPRRRMVGMESQNFGGWTTGFGFRHPGMEEIDGALYVSWSFDHEGHDADLWEPVKLSEYYALKEAAEEVPRG